MKIKISVYWADDWQSVILTKKEYQSIINGKSLSKNGEGYSYEGEDFSDRWLFAGGEDSRVVVTYDGCGDGFDGPLSACKIEEIED